MLLVVQDRLGGGSLPAPPFLPSPSADTVALALPVASVPPARAWWTTLASNGRRTTAIDYSSSNLF